MDAIIAYQKDPAEDFYVILGCDELSSTEQINAEYKIRALECHPDKRQGDDNANKQFALLQKAKEVLTDSAQREEYDKWRSSGLSISYADWKARKGSIETSLHWAMKTKKEPMIEPGPSTQGSSPSDRSWSYYSREPDFEEWGSSGWRREPANDVLRKFRNYEI